ncbi:hypothetical protein ACIA5G_52080 [Amycolatopsis sp. NPDC051758]|uniref:hypothetical protein n=1 Tax=Amycolatopsis sp. NPDC051758 TaxID=3363935 RepID=UPI00379D59E1
MQLPAKLSVHPDRNMIVFRDDEHDGYDPDFAASPRHGNLQSNTYQACLYTIQTLEPVTLHFTAAAPDHDAVGQATVGMPTGVLVVSEVTRGAHGPYSLPDGPGVYEICAYRHRGTTASPIVGDGIASGEHYVITVQRTADWHDEDDD